MIDPHRVPVVAIDSDCPPVPADRLTPKALRQRFLTPPGWAPEVRREPRFMDRPMMAAAVLIALIERPSGLTVLLTERANHLPTHAGQIAFAGGKIEADDAGPAAAALREAEEEVALASRFVEVLGSLPLYVTGSQFEITPVVALVHPGFSLHANPGEVSRIHEVPLSFLMDPAHHRRHRAEFAGAMREWFSMPWPAPPKVDDPSPDPSNCFIWGATAAMLRNLYVFLSA